VLQHIIETDCGAHRLGELGSNPDEQRTPRDPPLSKPLPNFDRYGDLAFAPNRTQSSRQSLSGFFPVQLSSLIGGNKQIEALHAAAERFRRYPTPLRHVSPPVGLMLNR
jgi:hypothetical protein